MSKMEELEERISQLTELVKSGTETIESLKKTLKAVKEERNRLVEEQEPKFERVKENEKYYFVDFDQYRENGGWFVENEIETGHPFDKASYNRNNYFHTEQRAQEVADKFNFLLKLERLHDIYCPDYVPDWNSSKNKYYIFYNVYDKRYGASFSSSSEYKTTVFFPTPIIAQKVCDILNAELEEKK